jgi:broad specificity phosphatase PhoE
MLYLVRHAMPIIEPAVDPSAWVLSQDGAAAARRLACALPGSALLVSSPEPKAWQTLDPDGTREVQRDGRLGEVRRAEAFGDEFRQVRWSYVSGSDRAGWEDRAEVARRFSAAVTQAAGCTRGRDLVIASHGMAMTVWLSHVVFLADPGGFWQDLRFPDLLTVDQGQRAVQRVDWN